MLKVFFLITLLAAFSTAQNQDPCGPNGILCEYDKMYESYKAKQVEDPKVNTHTIQQLLLKYFTGRLLIRQLDYLVQIDLASSDGMLLFPAPDIKVLSSVYLVDTDVKKIINRVVEEKEIDEVSGNSVVIRKVVTVTIVLVKGDWKIQNIKEGHVTKTFFSSN